MLIYNIHSSNIQFGVLQSQELGGGLLLGPPSCLHQLYYQRANTGENYTFTRGGMGLIYFYWVPELFTNCDLVTCGRVGFCMILSRLQQSQTLKKCPKTLLASKLPTLWLQCQVSTKIVFHIAMKPKKKKIKPLQPNL